MAWRRAVGCLSVAARARLPAPRHLGLGFSLAQRGLHASCPRFAAAGKKSKAVFVCDQCGAEHAKWSGQCFACKEWNTLKQFTPASVAPSSSRTSMKAARDSSAARQGVWKAGQGDLSAAPGFSLLSDTQDVGGDRVQLCCPEINRVLGGGLMRGSIVLLGGAPGIGKSTLLLQLAAELSTGQASLAPTAKGAAPSAGAGEPVEPTAAVAYVSGEESAGQLKARAARLGLPAGGTLVMNETNLETILQGLQDLLTVSPLPLAAVIVDSIQTMFLEEVAAAAGSVVQVRDCALRLLQFAKANGVPVILTGHITKAGELAGPRVLEHLVDAVLYVEGEAGHHHRLLRSGKNRFGSTAEVAVLEMGDGGLRSVEEAEGLFLSSAAGGAGPGSSWPPGSAVAVAMEGSRPLPVEVQALVTPTSFEYPRHRATGVGLDRLHMLLAVLQRHGRLNLRKCDVHVNVVGGVRLSDPAADLAIAMAVASSINDASIPVGTACVGEVGLSGELRPVAGLPLRCNSAARVGMQQVLLPHSGSRGNGVGKEVRQVPLRDVGSAVAWLAKQ